MSFEIGGNTYNKKGLKIGNTYFTPVSISASYSGANPTAGAAVSSLAGNVTVKAAFEGIGLTNVTVSDWSFENGAALIAEGANSVTVVWNGLECSFDVTGAAAAPATYDITVPNVAGATITVLVNGAAYTSGKLTHGDAVSITVAAQTDYNITSSSVTMGGQPVTGSNGEYNINSVTGAVEISVTVEAAPSPTGEYTSVSSTVANKVFTGTFASELPTTDIVEIEIRYVYDSSTNPINSRFVLLQKIGDVWKAWYKKFNDTSVDNITAGTIDIQQYTIAVHEAPSNSYAFSASVTGRTMYARTSLSDVDDVKTDWV